jgi:hypothetical protein
VNIFQPNLRSEKLGNNNNKGATGTTSRSLKQYLSNITGTHEIKELQKAALLGPAHILQKVIM